MRQTVCILFGGNSSEHEVSRASASNVLRQIDQDKFNVITVGITKSGSWYVTQASPDEIKSGAWEKRRNKACVPSPDPKHHGLLAFNKNGDYSVTRVDVIYPVLHGKNGEDGTVQGLFSLAGIPCVGPGILGSSLCMDKVSTKVVLEAGGIPVTEGFFVRKNYDAEDVHKKITESFGYPAVIKPSRAGSSVGVSLVNNQAELTKALEVAACEDDKILIERAVDAREIECAVLGTTEAPEASCLGEIIKEGMYDYNTKYVADTARPEIPANLSPELSEKIREMACRAFTLTECSGEARVDFFIDRKTGEVTLNEINTLPGFTDISMYPMLWGASGINYTDLITRLIELAR
ncbi:MAG: D-alanine--D-alanine ligase [Ruminococcaceae bacterium]|nr:D-alanine--D-alanine ligase [Oscillospiraceae bacterium]